MKSNFKFFFFLFSILFISCSNDFEDSTPQTSLELKTGSFIYKGVDYTSTYTELNDSTVIFTDKVVNNVYKNILANPNLAILEEVDGSVMFFDSHEELLQKRTQNGLRNSLAVAPTVRVNLVEHQLSVPNARYLSYFVSGTGDINNVVLHLPDLRKQNFDDILTGIDMSSFNRSVYRIELFKHLNYTGSSISFYCENRLAINDLRKHKIGGFLGIGAKHLDNEVTSLRVRFIAQF